MQTTSVRSLVASSAGHVSYIVENNQRPVDTADGVVLQARPYGGDYTRVVSRTHCGDGMLEEERSTGFVNRQRGIIRLQGLRNSGLGIEEDEPKQRSLR